MRNALIILLTLSLCAMVACKKTDVDEGPRLIFRFKFDSTQTRLNNFGNPSGELPAGHAAQSPRFRTMSSHYIELAPDSLTLLGRGAILYRAAETNAGGEMAIDFSKSVNAAEGEDFYSVPLSKVPPGFYKWLRVSLAYQHYDINLIYRTSLYNSGTPIALQGTVSSFIGFNTYIMTYKVANQNVTVNGNKKQGYGAIEITNLPPLAPAQSPFEWQARGTTVPNPIAATSPVPAGSCVVTGRFDQGLTITGNESKDVIVTVSLSTNKSFEWKDKNSDGLFEPVDGLNGNAVLDSVVDMGVRGLKPVVE